MKKAINRFLARTIGYELTKANRRPAPNPSTKGKPVTPPSEVKVSARKRVPPPDEATKARLAAIIGPSLRPVLLLSPSDDGRDALRLALSAHPDVYVAEAVTIADLHVRAAGGAERMLGEVGIGVVDLEHMLWDQLLRDQLARSGRRLVALADEKLPTRWQEAKDAWPAAHYVYLLRDPAELWARAKATNAGEDKLKRLSANVGAVHGARTHTPGLTLRYEELVSDPMAQLEALCHHIGADADAQAVKAMNDALISALQPSPKKFQGELPKALASAASSWGYA